MFSSSSAEAAKKKRELEKRQLEAAMAECTKQVESMRELQPEAAERVKSRLDAYIKSHPKLPMDFKRKVLAEARSYECFANMRAADAALRHALNDARHDDREVRTKLIGQARAFAAKAGALGADDEFKAAVKRKIEIIMMTGGVEHEGPTIAKPLSTAPVNPRHAKE